VELQKALIGHLDELVEMNNQLVIDEQFDVILPQEEMISRMKEFITGNAYDCYIIIENGLCCGYCLLDKTRIPIYLRHLFVKKTHRGKGLGKETIHALMNMYRSSQLDIEVMAWNENAIKFYNKLGFSCRYHGMRLDKHV
jgi:ribosomal protein S18 acetylase RimI-like enzyme